MNSKDLYNAIGKIEDDILEQSETAKKKSGRLKWGVMAACLCLTIGAFLLLRGPQVEVTEIGSLEEITLASGGNLVAERLMASGAQTANVCLSYRKGGDVSDPTTWNTLSITGDYHGQDFTLNCDYSSKENRKELAGAYAMIQYGDVEAAIYREEDGGSNLFLYRAEFILDGIAYNLSIHSDDPEDIYTYLDIVLGEPAGSGTPSGARITNVLGFDVCRVEMEEIVPYQYMWHFYAKVDGEDVCVAEQFGFDEPEAWSRDLDGDGVPELICNNTYGDGVQEITVYRNHNGVIEKGGTRNSYYEEKFGWTHLGESGISGLPVEKYDPEQGVFTAAYYANGYDNPVTVEFNDGLEPFDFFPFYHQS